MSSVIYRYISGITNLMACSRSVSAINEHKSQRGIQNCKESILYLQAPHRSPSILTARTASSINFISVSSSHGFTSRIILDLAIRAGSEIKTLSNPQGKFITLSAIYSLTFPYDHLRE